MFEQAFKNIDDILWKDAGSSSELDYTEQASWLLFQNTCCGSKKKFQGRSYDLLVSHTTVVFARYILLRWQHRRGTDDRFLGGLFFAMCDEVATKDWTEVLQQLIQPLDEIIHKTSTAVGNFIQKQLVGWFAVLPCYI